jgi:hypothetical protein
MSLAHGVIKETNGTERDKQMEILIGAFVLIMIISAVSIEGLSRYSEMGTNTRSYQHSCRSYDNYIQEL